MQLLAVLVLTAMSLLAHLLELEMVNTLRNSFHGVLSVPWVHIKRTMDNLIVSLVQFIKVLIEQVPEVSLIVKVCKRFKLCITMLCLL